MDRRLHLALGALVCVVLPALSWLDGSGRLAYGMFADVVWYRLELVAHDRSGRAFEISPTEIANGIGGTGAAFFAGADRFHFGVRSHTARARLEDVARFSCELRPEAAHVRVTLFERARPSAPALGGSPDGPSESTTVERTCPR